MLKFKLSKIKSFHNKLIAKYTDLENLKPLGNVLGLLNINGFASFVVWWYLSKTNPAGAWSYISISVAILWMVGYLFIKSSVYYSGAKWILWSWISLIFISPLGIVLLFYTSQSKYWELDIQQLNTPKSNKNMGKFFKSSVANLEYKWAAAMQQLESLDAKLMQQFVKATLGINNRGFKNWNEFQISIVLAMALLTKQFKQQNFDNFVWQAHWFDDMHFHFAIKNNKILNSKNKYIYSVAAVVLDEINNHQKTFNAQDMIKHNLKFSPAKIILLQWGEEYKLYINE